MMGEGEDLRIGYSKWSLGLTQNNSGRSEALKPSVLHVKSTSRYFIQFAVPFILRKESHAGFIFL